MQFGFSYSFKKRLNQIFRLRAIYLFDFSTRISKTARLKSGPAGQLPTASCNTCDGETGLIGWAVLGNSIIHTRKTSFESYSHLCHVSSKVFVSSVLQQKSLKKVILKWDEIINLQGQPTYTYLGWAVRELGDKTTGDFRGTLSTFGER